MVKLLNRRRSLQTLATAATVIILPAAAGAQTSRPETQTRVPAMDDTLSGWRQPVGDWTSGSAVTVHPDNPGRLQTTPGKGLIVNGTTGRTSNLFSILEHGDAHAHVEFMVPKGSNSGVYLMGRYEIQVLDSWGRETPGSGDCGGIYQRWENGRGFEGHPPKMNAARAPGQWQTFDIEFRAPRFDAQGAKTADARFIRVVHNGTVVHEDVPVTGPTRAAAFADEKPLGPLMLQGDHGPVAYRSIRITPLGGASAETMAEDPDALLAALRTLEFGDDMAVRVHLAHALDALEGEELEHLRAGARGLLADADATVCGRQMVCRVLVTAGTDADVPALAALLGHPALGHAARLALVASGSPAATASLRDAVTTCTGAQRIGIIGALGDLRDSQAIPQLSALTDDADPKTARAALAVLGRIGTPAAFEAVRSATPPRDLAGIRANAIIACAERLAGGRPDGRIAAALQTLTAPECAAHIRIAATRALTSHDAEAAEAASLSLLQAPETAAAAAPLLMCIRTQDGLATVGRLLPAAEARTQIRLLQALADRGSTDGIPLATDLLQADDAEVRQAAMRALGRVGDHSCALAMLDAGARDRDSRELAVELVSRLRDPETDSLLSTALQNPNAGLRRLAVAVLRNRRPDGLADSLLDSATDEDRTVRRESLQGLAESAMPRHVPALLGLFPDLASDADRAELQTAILATLERADEAAAGRLEAALIREAAGADATVRAGLLGILPGIAGESAADAAKAGLNDRNESVRAAAVRALAAWPDPTPAPDLLALAEDAPSPLHRLQALRGYIRLAGIVADNDHDTALEMYTRALNTAQRPEEKRLILADVADTADLRAVPFLKALMDDAEIGAEAKNAYVALCWHLRNLRVIENGALLHAKDAVVHGQGATYESGEDRQCVGNWNSASAWVSWPVTLARPGTFRIEVLQAMQGYAGSRYAVTFADQTLEGIVKETGAWDAFEPVPLGEITIPQAGSHTLHVKVVEKPGDFVMNLRGVRIMRRGATAEDAAAETTPVVLRAKDADIHGEGRLSYETPKDKDCIGNWDDARGWVSWTAALDAGAYAVEPGIAMIKGGDGTRYEIAVGSERVTGTVKATGSWTRFEPDMVGVITVPKRLDDAAVSLRILASDKPFMMNLRSITLTPVRLW